MYKLVIVEDEQDVRSRLAGMVPKSNSNFEVVAEYATGIDAYEGILADNPDLILTDIKIPYINGIALSKMVREAFPLVKIIIITGYNEFDYAKEAANLGVIGFISKPITLESLSALLKKAEASLDSEFLTASSLSELSAFYKSSLPIIREHDLYRLSNMADVPPAFEARLRGNNISLDYAYFALCIFDFDEIPEGDAERYDLVFSSIREAVGKDFTELCDYDLFNRHERLCLLLKYKSPPDTKELERRLERIIQRAGRYSSMPVSAGISRVFQNSKNFAAMAGEALRALEYRSVMGGQKVFFFGNSEFPDSKVSVDDSMIRELGYMLHSHPMEDCIGRIDLIRKSLEASGDSLYYASTGILNVLIRACNDLEKLYARYNGPDKIYRRLFEIKTVDEICDYLKELARQIRALNDNIIVDNVERNLRHVTSYMEAHFCDPNISFEALAKEVNFSVSYISALLKKKQGTSFIKMLTELRMERAKALLANPALKIIDIAEQVGYNDSYYFSHCFKKYMGMSPKEFRSHEQNKQAF